MQLDSELVRSGLVHDDPVVRQVCGYWLEDKGPQLAARTGEILDAYNRFGLSGLSHIKVRECDERLFDWVLEEAAQDFRESQFEDLQFRIVWEWLERANIDLVRSRLPDVRSAVAKWQSRHRSALLQLSVADDLEARLAAFDLGPDECWRQIIQRCRLLDSAEGEKYGYEEFWAAVGDMERHLESAALGNIAAQVIGTLEEDDRSNARIEIVAMIQLAERMHLEEAAPYALKLIGLDWDYLAEAVASYFQENCSQRLQQLVSEGFEDRPWYDRLYLSAVFAADHSPISAGHLRRFVAHELSMDDCDRNLVTQLAHVLASQFCTEDADTLDSIYRWNLQDPDCVQLAEYLHTLAVLGATGDPRDDSWSQAEATAEELRASTMASLLKFRKSEHAREQEDEEFEGDVVEIADLRSSVLSSGTTIRKAFTDHVGRNDPCPCGSGKKYKKCCLPSSGH